MQQATINVNGKPVVLELTQEQVDKITHASKPFIERCFSMSDVIKEMGEDPKDYLIPKDATPRQISRIRHARIDLLCEAARDGKELTTEDKWWYLVYNRPSNGKGWSLFCSDYYCGHACVGSRLCVCDEKTALHLDKHFRDEITAYLENRPGA